MREIELHSKKYPGLLALVDDEDYESVSQYRWIVSKRQGIFYAQAYGRDNGRNWKIYLHKLITGYPMTDHEDHDGLNNQRSNLRPATRVQNAANVRKQAGTTSRYKGVSWSRSNRGWIAQITANFNRVHLGTFASEIAAALAYDRAAIEAHGEFACTNAMMGLLPTKSQFALAA